MPLRSRTLHATVILTVLTVFLLPALGLAYSFQMTGFVPELATPTLDIIYSYQSEKLDDYDLEGHRIGGRLSYVIYPALEAIIGFNLLDYELEGKDENGVSVDLGFKYQFQQFSGSVDFSLALMGDIGQTDTISFFDGMLLAIVSQDVGTGWTPYLGGGIGYSVQDFEGDVGLPEARENQLEPIIYGGLKYMYKNHLGASMEAFYKDGVGIGFDLSYRF